MTANKEIERKFLLSADYQPPNEGSLVQQFYLSRDPERVVRIRIIDEELAYLTIKGKNEKFSRIEVETTLTLPTATLLKSLALGSILRKTRHIVGLGNHLAEVDIFLEPDSVAGMKLVEVEFDTLEEAESFSPPEWFGKEVTNDPKYANSNID